MVSGLTCQTSCSLPGMAVNLVDTRSSADQVAKRSRVDEADVVEVAVMTSALDGDRFIAQPINAFDLFLSQLLDSRH